MNKKIKLCLNKLQWSLLSSLLREVVLISPVQDAEVDSLVACELYQKKLFFFTIFPNDKKEVKLTLTQAQAYAINNLFKPTSQDYNTFIALYIEPHLSPCKYIENT